MLNALTSYQFEQDEPVRVVMVGGEPWFVANDLSRLLGYAKAPDMVRMLPPQWAGTHILRSGGQNRSMTIVNEAGMWKAVMNSRREEAVRIQEWLFSEVLPAIRKTGTYTVPGMSEPPPLVDLDIDVARLTAAVGVVREARQIFGPVKARDVWVKLGLPAPIADSAETDQADEIVDELRRATTGIDTATTEELLDALAVPASRRGEFKLRRRVTEGIRLLGWTRAVQRRAGVATKVWTRPAIGAAPAVEA